MRYPQLNSDISRILKRGAVIPAHPLALNRHLKLDERRQRALTRYYLEAGSGGIAVGVHTTQFEIRLPEHGLLEPVLELAAEEINGYCHRTGRAVIKIAGVTGKTQQALAEGELAARLGYDAALLSLAAFQKESNEEMLEHCRVVAEIIPLIGFYLQPAVGGRRLDVAFWREFARIENVVAIKMAPFNRYATLDVIRGVAESGRASDVALYTGNDDNIVADLLTEYKIAVNGTIIRKRIVGGLLGHWAVWTKRAVELLERIQSAGDSAEISKLLTLGAKITEANAALFDVAHDFKGCIVGIHEVLRRQGLLEGIWTLNPDDILTPSQEAEINRIYISYPELNDDDFVAANLDHWLN